MKRPRHKKKTLCAVRKNEQPPPDIEQPAPKPQVSPQTQGFSFYWKETWAYIGPVVALVGAWSFWSPAVSIAAGANLDASQKLATEFVVSNVGRVPIYNVTFECDLLGKEMLITELDLDSSGLR